MFALDGSVLRLLRGGYGVQLGFATDTSKPAVLLGLSLDLGKWLRLGSGYGFHQNQRLARGESVGQPPSKGGSAAPTASYYSGHFYLSLSFSLDGIALFNSLKWPKREPS